MAKRSQTVDLDYFHDYGVFLPGRMIYLSSVQSDTEGAETGVDVFMTRQFIKNLTFLENLNADPITIILDSPGGDWYTGMAIFDAIASARSHITIRGTGRIMSMGSVIFQAADTRVLTSNAALMLHYGDETISAHSRGIMPVAREIDRVNATMEDIYLTRLKERHPTFSRKQLRSLMAHDWYLTPKQALKYGLCDSIADLT